MAKPNANASACRDLNALAKSVADQLAKNALDASAAAGGDSATALLARGKAFQLASYFEEAAQSFEAAVAIDPNLSEARARLAVVQMRASQPQRALATAMDLAQSEPSFLLHELTSSQAMSAMTILGDALSLNGRVEDALEAYRNAVKRSPKDMFAAGRLAQAYLSLGDAKSAFEQADKIANNPRFHSLTRLLRLGNETLAVLPRQNGNMAALLAVSAHGRPMIVNDHASTAPLVFAPTGWCAFEA